jgi:hypothetical protein
MPFDAIKFWIAVVAISIGIAVFRGDVGSGIIFLFAGAAVFFYWRMRSSRRRRGNDE